MTNDRTPPGIGTPKDAQESTTKGGSHQFVPKPTMQFVPDFPGYNGLPFVMDPTLWQPLIPEAGILTDDNARQLGRGIEAAMLEETMLPLNEAKSTTLIPEIEEVIPNTTFGGSFDDVSDQKRDGFMN